MSNRSASASMLIHLTHYLGSGLNVWYFSWNEEVIYVNNKEHFDEYIRFLSIVLMFSVNTA